MTDKFEFPEIKILIFGSEDIIATSNEDDETPEISN